MGPLLQAVLVPLNGVPSFYYVNCTTQLSVIYILGEGTLSPIVFVIDKDVEEHQSQDGLLSDTTWGGLNLDV